MGSVACQCGVKPPLSTARRWGLAQFQIFSLTCKSNSPSADRLDLANEINELINKLQILKPSISYAELTNVIIAAVCPIIANMNLTSSEKWDRMRQFDTILQRQLAVDMLPPGTLIIANIPLPPAVYRELRSQAAKVNQKPGQFMAAILTRAAGN